MLDVCNTFNVFYSPFILGGECMLRKLVPILIIIVLLLSSCGSPAPAAAPQATTAPKTATFIFTQEFDNLNPAYSNMWFSQITQQIWNCWPWSFDDKNTAFPVLVKEMPSAANGGLSADGSL